MNVKMESIGLFITQQSESYSELCQTPEIELFVRIVNG